jgi:hypothetical protein
MGWFWERFGNVFRGIFWDFLVFYRREANFLDFGVLYIGMRVGNEVYRR